MTLNEYLTTDWKRGNIVKLTNGKEYSVAKPKKKCLILYSDEYDAHFVADHRIIECRTSDASAPDARPSMYPYTYDPATDTYTPAAIPVAEPAAAPAPKKCKAKAEKTVAKETKAESCDTVTKDAPTKATAAEAPKATAADVPAAEPKKKRKHISIKRAVKVEM